MTQAISFVGGHVATPVGSFAVSVVHFADRVIVEAILASSTAIDCGGLHVLPGMVDVHGDAFEAVLFPRPGFDIPFAIAMRSVDRQLVTNGITTAFHGLSLSWIELRPEIRTLT